MRIGHTAAHAQVSPQMQKWTAWWYMRRPRALHFEMKYMPGTTMHEGIPCPTQSKRRQIRAAHRSFCMFHIANMSSVEQQGCYCSGHNGLLCFSVSPQTPSPQLSLSVSPTTGQTTLLLDAKIETDCQQPQGKW